ncbi:MAG: NlpC/P60 family protein [Myxococcota bacterium]
MVEYAERLRRRIAGWLGTPYRWGGETKRVGTDCSGFTQGLFREEFQIALPRVSRDQFRMGYSVSRRNLRPGDLVFFDTLDQGRITHVGVYVGKDQFAHASSSKGVTYAKLKLRYFTRAYRGARRILSYP